MGGQIAGKDQQTILDGAARLRDLHRLKADAHDGWEAANRAYHRITQRVAAEIARMKADGNDPMAAKHRYDGPMTDDDHYNAGRIAGLRLALDYLEGRA